MKDVTVKVGSHVMLTCSYESNLDDTQVAWTRLSDNQLLTNENAFEISTASFDQSGSYKCRVTNNVCDVTIRKITFCLTTMFVTKQFENWRIFKYYFKKIVLHQTFLTKEFENCF